jgi:hypothetical protein
VNNLVLDYISPCALVLTKILAPTMSTSPSKDFLNKGGIKVNCGIWKKFYQIKITATGTRHSLKSTCTGTWVSMSITATKRLTRI